MADGQTPAQAVRNRIVGIRRVRFCDLVPNPVNWRMHDQRQRTALRGVLESVGYAGAPLCRQLPDGRLMIIDGHLRAEELPDMEIDALVTDLSEAEADALLLTYDPISAMAKANADAFSEIAARISVEDERVKALIAETAKGIGAKVGWEGAGGEDAPEPQIDRAAELQQVWQTARGQVWEVPSQRTPGKSHRIMCGDSTDAGDVARLMGGEKAKLTITDPPYGVEYADKNKFLNAIAPGNRIQTHIEGDHGSKEETQALWKAAFKCMSEVMGKGAVVYCFMPQGGDQMMMMMMMMMGAGIEPRHELIWLKNNHVLGRTDYAYKHEPILYAWKDGGHKFYGDFQTSVIECNKPQKSDLHPTTKPVELISRLVSNSSLPGEIIYDPFIGSGTSILAAEQTGRIGRGMEIAPEYVAVALQRLADMGLSPVLVSEPEAVTCG